MIKHEICFQFQNREKEDIDKINEVLSCMELSNLQLENFEGYMCTTYSREKQVIRRRYGFDQGTLVCETKSGESKYHYQIMTEAFGEDEDNKIQNYHEYWVEKYPDKIMRTMLKIQFEEAVAHIVLYHERK